MRTESSVPAADQTQHTTVLVTLNPAVTRLSAHSDGGADGGGAGWGAALRPATHLLPGTVDPFICHAKAAGLADRHGIRLAHTTGHSELGAGQAHDQADLDADSRALFYDSARIALLHSAPVLVTSVRCLYGKSVKEVGMATSTVSHRRNRLLLMSVEDRFLGTDSTLYSYMYSA